MERVEFKSIGDVLREVIAENQMEDRLNELKAIDCWSSVIGDYIAARCARPIVRKGIMTVKIPDAGLRHELSMHRSAIIRDINRLVGKDIILNLRFIS